MPTLDTAPTTLPDRAALDAAWARVREHAHRTPVLRSSYFDDRLGAEIVFKCENFQKIGAFTARGALNAVLEGITYGLKKEKNVTLVGFGSFNVRRREGRMGRNPQTGEPIKIKASKTVTFKAGKALKDAVPMPKKG